MKSHPEQPLVMSASSILCLCTAWLLFLVPSTGLAEMAISGLDARLETNVRAMSPLSTASCDSAPWRVERLFRDADKDITNALRALGYYEAVINKSLHWGDDCWRADIRIQAGEPVRLRNVKIEIGGDAALDTAFMNRISTARPASGEVFDHGRYSNFKSALLSSAMSTGFFDAKFDSSTVTVDRDARSADLIMEFQSGEKYRFGEVRFTEGILRDNLLQGYADIKAGEPYSSKMISDLYEALNGSSYFSSVSIKTEPLDSAGKTVPVTVELTSAKRRVYSVGGGFTTDLGPHGRIGYTNRRINDKGHQFESKLFGSSVNSELNAAYRWPMRNPRREWFSIVTGLQHENTETSEHDSFKLGFLRSKSMGPAWMRTRYIDYAYEDFTVGIQSSTSHLVILGTNWETAEGRALSRATHGHRLNLDLRGASDALGSDTSFLQLRVKAKWVHAFGDRTRLLAKASLGLTAKDELSELPASVRFFAGGDSSVRGYEYETLGPVDADGNVIGGSHQIDGSLEIDRLIRDKWAVALFVDSGNAFNTFDIDLYTGVGIGLRWYSPVGPIRLDFAHPLDDPDQNFRIHISLGPDL